MGKAERFFQIPTPVADEKPPTGPKTRLEGELEVAKIKKSGAEIIDIGLPTSEDIRTNFEKLRNARIEFEKTVQHIEKMTDPGLRDATIISMLTRIELILNNNDIQPQDLTTVNKDNLSREKYKTELERLKLIKRQLEKL